LKLKNQYIRYMLVGIYRDENFTYARAAIIPSLRVSFIVESKAEEIKCVEKLDQKYVLKNDLIGIIGIDRICAIDMIVTEKGYQKIKLILNVVKDEILRKIACDAVFGLDAITVLDLPLFL